MVSILHDIEGLLIVNYAEMMGESKRVIMDMEETGDEGTTVHVEVWMLDERVLICFYVDLGDLEGDLRRRQGEPHHRHLRWRATVYGLPR